MQLPRDMAQMNAQELRDLATSLFAQVTQKDHELKHKQLKIDQLTHEMAILKRWQFGRRSERLDPAQRSLLEETIDADLEAIEPELPSVRRPYRVAQHFRRICRDGISLTSPTAPCAGADVSSSASGKRSASGSTTSLDPSRWNATFEASGCAGAARRSSKHRCRRRSSTRGSRAPAFWPTC